MKRSTTTFWLGAIVGVSAALVLYGVVKAARAEDAERLTRKLNRRIGKLESRVEPEAGKSARRTA